MVKLSSYSPARTLIILAAVTVLIYGGLFSLPFPLSHFYATIPPVDYAKLTHRSWLAAGAYFLGIGLTFGVYGLALKTVWGKPAINPIFIGLTAILLASSLILSYPVTAIDMFVYALQSRGWALYDLNPLAYPINTFPPADPWRGLASEWAKNASPYGTVWELLALAMFYLSGGDFFTQLMALKGLGVVAYLGCLGLIYLIMRQHQPEWVTVALVAWAWNPLVLLETVQNGHNDIVLSFFFLAAIYTYGLAENRADGLRLLFYSVTCVALALSILVKFITLLVVPFFLLAMTRHVPRKVTRLMYITFYGAMIGGVVVVAMAPLWPGLSQWTVLRAVGQGGYSLSGFLAFWLKLILSDDLPLKVARGLAHALFIAIYLYQLWRALQPTPAPWSQVVKLSFQTLFWYVLLVIPLFHAWYLLWFVPLASLLLPDSASFKATFIFSVTAILVIPFFETWRGGYPDMYRNYYAIIRLVALLLLFGLPAWALIRPSYQYKLK